MHFYQGCQDKQMKNAKGCQKFQKGQILKNVKRSKAKFCMKLNISRISNNDVRLATTS